MDAEQVAWLAGEVELRQADQATGLVPADVTRPLYPWELAAHTDFAGLEQDVDGTAATLARLLETDRATFIALLDADLTAVANNPGQLPQNVAVAARLLNLDSVQGIASIAGVSALIAASEAKYRDILADAALTGGRRAHAEASDQGVDVSGAPVKLGGLDEYRLDLAAQRLAQAPHADVLAAAAESAYRVPDVGTGGLRTQIIHDLHQLSPQPLLGTLARPVTQQADTIGRLAAMTSIPQANRYYASELLDRNTCGPCQTIDGTQYDTLAEAKRDYPAGGYKDCSGGVRCRGTIVGVWDEVPPGH